MNQVSLIEESFEKCPREAVANGSIGTIPYCVITCNEGYHIDDNGVACVEDELLDKEGEGAGEDPETPEDLPQQKETSAQQKQTNPPRRANQFHYTGAGLRLNLIDTTDLTGQELRNAQRRNLEINKRRGGNESNNKKDESSALSSLTKIVNDIRGKLWSWETGAKNDKLIVTSKENGELELNQGTSGEESGESESYGEETMHSAPLLPSTGSSTIFIVISILGIGLMLFAFNKR
jgi:ferredoxin